MRGNEGCDLPTLFTAITLNTYDVPGCNGITRACVCSEGVSLGGISRVIIMSYYYMNFRLNPNDENLNEEICICMCNFIFLHTK